MTRPMRILVLIDAFRMGGAETLLAPLAAASAGTDVVMDFVGVSPESVNADKTMTILADAGIRPRSLGIHRLLDRRALPRLVAEIRGYDLVHAHLEMAMTLAVPAARLARRPVFCTFHHVARPLEGRAHWRERLAVEAASRSNGALFVSEASRASFQQRYRPSGLPPNWGVLHNGIDVDLYRPGPANPAVRREIGGSAGPLVVLPAAFRDFKGIPVAVQAWRTVHHQHPDATLALVGGGPLEPELRAAVDAAGLTESIVFAGVRTDMPEVYRAADVILLPSTHGENLPTVLIEASASGRAIAASRIGGVPDIVADEATGLLFEPNDPAALAFTIGRLIQDAELRKTLGQKAVLRAAQEFSAAAWLSRLRTLYSDALAPRW
jgi:glycosyltransferase involved in cell wall biosynthesis